MSDTRVRRPAAAPAGLRISRRAAWFLVAVGVWSWIIWPTFLKNIWADDRSFDDGPTAFLVVHVVLTVASLAIGTAVAAVGVRALRAAPHAE